MSKLDDILQELQDYIEAVVAGDNPEAGTPTKQQIKALMLELTADEYEKSIKAGIPRWYRSMVALRNRIQEL